MFSINIKNKLRFLVTNERGSALVEVAFVLIPFIVTILFIAELCRVTFISSSLDLVLAESGKISSMSVSHDDYKNKFETEFKNRVMAWPLFSKNMKIEQDITSCENLAALVNSGVLCSSSQHKNNALAVYTVKIDYSPVFFIFPLKMVNNELQRKIVLIQEFQRKEDEF